MLAGLMAGVDRVRPGELLFITLTGPGDVGPEWNEGASERWDNFMGSVRRVFKGARLDFWKVGELQKRGVIHYHVVLRGLRFFPKALLERLAVASGFGEVCWVEHPKDRRGGVRGYCLGYLPKYLAKSTQAWEYSQHVVTHSQNWRLRWIQHVSRGSDWRYCRSEADAFREMAYAGIIEVPAAPRVEERLARLRRELVEPGSG
jgi:hypothetical protein